jgi:L-rhamnose-H+ transport protein
MWTLAGVGVSLLGIVFSGVAGLGKEKEITDEQKRATVAEFSSAKACSSRAFAGC